MTSPARVTVFAPATVANVASGFDVLGFALDSPGDAVTITRVPGDAVAVVAITGEGGKLPRDPKKNTAAVTTKLSKSQVLLSVAEATSLTRKQVGSVLDEIESLIARSIGKKGLGEFTIPGLLKITTVKKPARKARKGINPFTGEETTFKAKPASVAVKVRPLKKLKEFVEA